MANEHRTSAPPGALVAVAGFVIPGAGYLLLRQWARGLTIGLTILILFGLGLLIGGIRVIEVPGYDDSGSAIYAHVEERRQDGGFVRMEVHDRGPDGEWILQVHPLAELVNKPWFAPQVLTGPVALVAAYESVQAARPVEGRPGEEGVARSHSRVAEIGTLYTAVAGMLNLMAIIDSAYRAGQEGSK